MPVSYNKSLLEEICIRDKCIIDFDKIEKYTRDTKIDFTCSCGDINSKSFRTINNIGCYCKKCTQNNRQEKIKQTCLKKFGVEYATQKQEVKDKIKETCLERYGVENISQKQEVKNKKRENCLLNKGV
jgi:hypothetical protein